MFIVWRKRPITTDRPAELFVAYTDITAHDMDGKVTASGRRRDNSLDRPAWMQPPLRCQHTGPGRIAWTPLLMHAERVDGKPRQKLLRRLHTLRSCCMKNPFTLAAWWYAIDSEVNLWEEDAFCEEARYAARDRRAVLAKLREVAPRPTKAGVEAFTAFRLGKKAEQDRAYDEWMAGFRRQAEEQGRRRAEQEGRAYQPPGAAFRDFGKPHWSEVLGVKRTATFAEVKARWREVALQHHPDRGGDQEAFVRVKEAYERAERDFEGRVT